MKVHVAAGWILAGLLVFAQLGAQCNTNENTNSQLQQQLQQQQRQIDDLKRQQNANEAESARRERTEQRRREEAIQKQAQDRIK